MYIGIDLGTSGIKLVLTNQDGQVIATQSADLTVSRPAPLHSEQAPQDWVAALHSAMNQLAQDHALNQVKAIGLSGQMHGAVLLDSNNDVVRPAILWNDGRSHQECIELEQAVPNSREITGNLMMPGFTAPKLLWVKKHEPENFAKVAKVLLPKDYLRFVLSGDFASDMSDSAGTLWLDVGKRAWSKPLLAACSLTESHMPNLFEGSEVTGHLHQDLAQRWGMDAVAIVAGGGDNAAGAVGVGLTQPGQAMLSLGTSGVYFVVSDEYTSNPESAVHSFCHALPNTWHLMSVLLSAASCVSWFAESIAKQHLPTLLAELGDDIVIDDNSPFFLPYLSGERTPHNNPYAAGNFFGLSHETDKKAMFFAVLEGVSLAFADGVEALHASGTQAKEIMLIGGGAKHVGWRQLLADVLNRPIKFCEAGEVGPGLGAARLAQLAVDKDTPFAHICRTPDTVAVYEPNAQRHAMFAKRQEKFRAIYQQLKPLFVADE
ncbi:xylulokinase [Glaciecola siphonariae]|uniref:Xylulose kinase n=1 Tax=Glaciecola siphonariae TaxID=521012 RepID=A0ABV9LZ10_9ALTE